jgi:hypothetical protein
MIDTAWCIVLTLTAPLILGAPWRWLLGGCRPLDRQGWVLAPFMGIGVTVLVLQTLVYADFPIRRTAWLPWALAALLWISMAWRGQLREGLRTAPWGLFGVAAGVYLLQGVGLLVLGVDHYVGHAWSDQFNYTVQAEFFARWPYSTGLDVLSEAPWLGCGVGLKDDRIGQTVLHAFLMVSADEGSRQLFGPIILLGAPLTVLAIHGLAERFGLSGARARLAAAATGLLPAVAILHQDCFLSHALGAPLLLMLLVGLDDLARAPGVGTLLRAVVLLNALLSVYTEFMIVVAGLLLLQVALAVACRRLSWRLALCSAALLVSPLVVNWHYAVRMALTIGLRAQLPVLAEVYPWGTTVAGWGRAWFGNLAEAADGPLATFVRIGTITLTGLGYLGLLRVWNAFRLRHAAGNTARAFSDFAAASMVLAVALLPLVVLLKDERLVYQVYKLLLTTLPLVVLGLALFGLPAPQPAEGVQRPEASGRLRGARLRGLPSMVLAALALVAGGYGTVDVALRSSRTMPQPRSLAYRLLTPDMRQIQAALERTSGADLVIAHLDGFERSWLAYYGRHHRVRLALGPMVNLDLSVCPQAAPALRLEKVNPGALFITQNQVQFARVDPGDLEALVPGPTCQLWRSRSDTWALPLVVTNPNGLEQVDGKPFYWLGTEPAQIDLLAGAPGWITLRAELLPGPSLLTTRTRSLRVRGAGGFEGLIRTEGGEGTIRVPVTAGHSTIWLECLDAPASARPASRDPRTLLLGVKGLEVVFTADAGAPNGAVHDRTGGGQ